MSVHTPTDLEYRLRVTEDDGPWCVSVGPSNDPSMFVWWSHLSRGSALRLARLLRAKNPHHVVRVLRTEHLGDDADGWSFCTVTAG